LTSQPGYDFEPTWSPDALLIAFSLSPNQAGGNLTVIKAANGEQLKLPHIEARFTSKSKGRGLNLKQTSSIV
jgi:Tol biopolymer transport system component